MNIMQRIVLSKKTGTVHERDAESSACGYGFLWEIWKKIQVIENTLCYTSLNK